MNVQSNNPNPKKPVLRPGTQPVHFGAGEVSGLTGLVDKGFQRLTADRTTQLLVEDFVGFGLMRTGIDLWRGKAYGNDQVNWAAGSERMGRESASIFTDNILAGVVAALIGKYAFDQVNGSNKAAAFHNQFVEYPTLEKFQSALAKPGNPGGEAAFLKNLAESYFTKDHQEAGGKLLEEVWNEPRTQTNAGFAQSIENKTKAFFNTLNDPSNTTKSLCKNGFTYVSEVDKEGKPTKSFNLNTLLEDVRAFSKHTLKLEDAQSEAAKLAQKNGNQFTAKSWQTLAEESVARTIKAKGVTIPVGLGVAMAATFAVPFAISGISRKFFGIDYYPGEIGLRQEDSKASGAEHKKSFWERHAPYLTESIKKGNYWPLLGTLAPLPLAAGLWNTTKLNKLGLPERVKSLKEWKHLFDYQKLKPFTAQQQMASLFALLITARLLNSRSDNEYRERMLDSFVGWGAWIMGTPLLNKVAGNLSDSLFKTKLVKADGSMRTRAEIDALKELKEVSGEAANKIYQRTLKSHIWMNFGTTCTTMAGLGLFIPWLAIKLTQNNEKHKQQLRAAQASSSPVGQRMNNIPAKPWANAVSTSPVMPFSPLANNGPRPGFAPAIGVSAQRNPWLSPNAIANQAQG